MGMTEVERPAEIAKVRRRVIAAATAPKSGEDPEFEALATSALIAAFNRLAPDDMVLAPVALPPERG